MAGVINRGEGKLALEAWDKLGIKGELSQSGMPQVQGIPAMQVRVATMGEEIGQTLSTAAPFFDIDWERIHSMQAYLSYRDLGLDPEMLWLSIEQEIPLLKEQIGGKDN